MSDQSGVPSNPQFLPPIGFDVPEWLQNWLAEVSTVIEGLAVDPTPPAQPTGVNLTQAYPGIVVRWNQTIGASRYVVYRNTSGTFETAQIVAILPGQTNISTLNITSDLASNATIYYWIVAENASGIRGPISAMVSTGNSTPPIPGTITTSTDLTMAFIATDPDEWNEIVALAGTDLGSDSNVIWMSEGEDGYWITSDMEGVSI